MLRFRHRCGYFFSAALPVLNFFVFVPATAQAEQIYSVQMHVHGSLSEGAGTMMSHTYQAELSDIDVLWWSDHSERTTLNPIFTLLSSFDFENGMAETFPVYPDFTAKEWVPYSRGLTPFIDTVTEQAYSGAQSLKIAGTAPVASKGSAYVAYITFRNFVRKSLLTELKIKLALFPQFVGGKQKIFITCRLSNDTRGKLNQIKYVISNGGIPRDKPPNTYYIRLENIYLDAWNVLELPVTEDARRLFPEGDDQSLREVRVEISAIDGGTVTAYIDDFSLELTGPAGDDLFAEQNAVLQHRYADNIKQLVGWEIVDPNSIFSLQSGLHLNAFMPSGTAAQVVDFEDPIWDADEFPGNVIDYIHSSGGIVSYNHMFGVSGLLPDEEVEIVKQDLIATRIFGVDLLEIGYVLRGRPLVDFLSVWDALSMAGVRVTGIGVSDQHDSTPWSDFRNPFVTWVFSNSNKAADLITGLKAGRAFFGNPHLFDPEGRIDLRDASGQFEMGDLVTIKQPLEFIDITVDGVVAGDNIFFIENGVVSEVTQASSTSLAWLVDVNTESPVVVRVEVYAADGSPKVFSNPIYFVN